MAQAAILDWSGAMLPAQDELSDGEILERYGSLLQRAVSAFRDDPLYLVAMAESAAKLKRRREMTNKVA
jgi:hypothetical protein